MVERDRGRGSGSVDNKTAKGATCGAGVAGIASVAGVDCISYPLMNTGCVACSPAVMGSGKVDKESFPMSLRS